MAGLVFAYMYNTHTFMMKACARSLAMGSAKYVELTQCCSHGEKNIAGLFYSYEQSCAPFTQINFFLSENNNMGGGRWLSFISPTHANSTRRIILNYNVQFNPIGHTDGQADEQGVSVNNVSLSYLHCIWRWGGSTTR